MLSQKIIDLTETCCAHNYHPLEVVLTRGRGSWVWDIDGVRYLDMLSAYSAMNFGHSNPRILRAARAQLGRMTLTSRAFFNDQLGPLAEALTRLARKEMMLPMVSGAEAVETSIKAARRWGYEVKGTAPDAAEIICFEGNFAGRTTTLISFSDNEHYRRGFGPFTPGFRLAPFGDIAAVRKLVNENTVGILVEPIQGEGGVIVPPDGFLRDLRSLCDEHHMLMLADEVQTGLCRTGDIFACDHEGVVPDIYIIGKSLGGGITPLSAVIADRNILEVFDPGSHGSTFGGNSLACAVGREVIRLIEEEKPHEHARDLGSWMLDELRAVRSSRVRDIRGRGLMIGIEFHPDAGPAMDYCRKLKALGILCKDTREQIMRLAPPLTIKQKDLQRAIKSIRKILQ